VVAKGYLHTHVELGLGYTIRLRLVRRFGHSNYARLDTRALTGVVTKWSAHAVMLGGADGKEYQVACSSMLEAF